MTQFCIHIAYQIILLSLTCQPQLVVIMSLKIQTLYKVAYETTLYDCQVVKINRFNIEAFMYTFRPARDIKTEVRTSP